MKQSRRDFLRVLTGAGALLGSGLLLPSFKKNEEVRIVILHTNDVHSHIDPFPANDPKYPGLGGVERRAAMIREIRAKEKNVLLFDAGDMFQGTPYFNMYGGEPEIRLMSQMGYDASAIGNHDFDAGLENLAKQLEHATFPLLCANYDFTGTPMEGKCAEYKVFVKDDVRIGVFGLGIELAGLVDPRLYGKTKYIDPIEKAAVVSQTLRAKEKCDIVVCLSHLGYQYDNKKLSDLVLAEKSRNIDIIIGGHTHTFLEKATLARNAEGKEIYVTQAGWAGIRLGSITLSINKQTRKNSLESASVVVGTKSSTG